MLVVWLVYKFISSAFSALEAKYYDNDCVDKEDEARSSSGVLILALRCEISAALEPDLKQNLSPAGFTLDPQDVEHETQISAILDAANRWWWQTAGTSNTWQNIFSDLQNIFLDLATSFGFANLFEIYKIIFADSIIL